MCDLIDLNSPDARGALKSAKLASPLIPAPRSIEHVDGGTGTTESAAEKREGDGNNPFDRVLHETAEYVSKKGDPFEVMLQRALRSKSWRNAQPVGFTDDFTPKKKKRYCKTMNKTLGMLDELFLESRFGLFDVGKREARIKAGRGVGVDARDADVRAGSNAADDASASKQEPKIFAAASDSLELSILNQSAMNDTLLDVFPKSKENGEVSPFLETDTSFREFVFPSNRLHHFKLRSLSQGTGKSPTGPSYLNRRSQSVTDGRRTVSQSDNSTVSSFLDRGFMESRQSEQSVFSSLSNVSSITKLTSASLSSSILSNDAINHAFLDDGSSRTSRERTTAIESSMEVKLKEYDLTDLAERLNKLKCAMNTTNISSVTKDSSSTKREDNKRTTSSKLIDVDVFVPEPNKEFNRSSSSTCSSDSVFTNTNKVDKSILKEAKVLAKTFDEMALKTDSGSTTDDLISNNTLWMSELLPAFEDEPVVNNLIDLPGSPEGNLKNIQNSDKKQSPASIDSAEELFKKMESSLTDAPAVKQDVTSLLSDLRKLVKTESNPEAKKLLDNLENILDINYKNNTELLMSCFNVPNKSSQSPQKVSSESIERFDKSSVDKSEDTSGKASFQEKLCNAEKSLSNITSKSEDTSRDAVSIEKSFSSCKDNNEDRTSTTHSSDKDNQVDKKVAIELLVNLRKLLSGQAEDDVTMQLLKNIGKVLNTALNNGTESETRANCTGRQNIQQTTPVRKPPESARDVHSSALSTKVAQRRSLEPKSKTVRRSVSAVESSPKNTSSTQIRRRRSNVSESENHQKRLSGNSGFINNLNSNKKLAMPEARNTRKAEAAKPDSKKENSIAISAPVLSDVKNKLKKRSDVVNKRGPVKAVHPVDNMKKRASLGRQTQSSRITTPPKSSKATSSGSKIISSTPNSSDNNCYMPKKPTKSKPIASSTPDQNSASAPLASANKKRNFSCDISPVTTYANMSGSDERKESPPKRMSKLPTPKKCTTPTRQRSDGIPRFLTPPRHYSSSTNNPQSPQRLNRSLINFQRYSPLSEKQSVEKVPRQSPLKEANRITAKVKPLNLISKIKRHSQGDFGEKENYV